MLNFIIFIILFKIPLLYGFSECPNSTYADPLIVNVTSCSLWAAYVQSVGQNFQYFCQNEQIALKCCWTCKAYESFTVCENKASQADCEPFSSTDRCDIRLSDGRPISYYCARSCRACKITDGPKCEDVGSRCGVNGNCTIATHFGITISQCKCSNGYFGHSCNRRDFCKSSNPCLNNGTCSTVNDEDTIYLCNCPVGCFGRNCENCTCDAGGSFECMNDAECKNSKCACPIGYIGNKCEEYDPNSTTHSTHISKALLQLSLILTLFSSTL